MRKRRKEHCDRHDNLGDSEDFNYKKEIMRTTTESTKNSNNQEKSSQTQNLA